MSEQGPPASYRVAATCVVITTVALPVVVITFLVDGRGPVVPVVAFLAWACLLLLFLRLRLRVQAMPGGTRQG